MPRYRFPWHLQALEAACLRLMSDPNYNRLIVELPVRHGKSLYCAWALPAWHMLTRPHRNVIIATYQSRFSDEWSHKVQETVRQYGERLTGIGLGGIRTRQHWCLSSPYAGQLRTTSPLAGVAGKGAHLIIADDLVKDMKEAESTARRQTLSTWFHAELLTRLEPGGKVLLVMSRRHPDDQSGRCIAMNPELPPAEQWHRLTLPAIGEDGRALWPWRWPVESLLAKKRDYELAGKSYLWDCLYQQDPRGNSYLIEWPDIYFADGDWTIGYDELPPALPIKWRLLSLDPSKGSRSRTGDYSAWTDATIDANAVAWVHPHLQVISAEAVEDYSVELLRRKRYDAFIVECNGFQELIADNIVRKCRAAGVHCPLFKKVSTEDKEVRIRLGIGPILAQKRLRLCARSTSYRLALSQLKEFPTAAHDDFPDSLNLLFDLINHLMRGGKL